MSDFYSRAEIKDAARGKWISVLGSLGVKVEMLRNVHGPCPGCGGRDRFRFDDQGGDGSFLCSQGGGGLLAGDGVELLGHVTGWDWKRCHEELGRLLLPGGPRGGGGAAHGLPINAGVAPEPGVKVEKRREVDLGRVEGFVRGVPAIDEAFLGRRSTLDVETCGPTEFLQALYAPAERVLVFTSQWSQGDFLFEPGRGGFRLSATRGVQAVPSPLPTMGKEGVWFLNQPVTGAWCVKPGTQEKEAQWTRRSWPTVTSWRHYVLESDVLEPELWLRVLARVKLPIVAIYTSGGRSVHALLRCEVANKASWDATRDVIGQLMCPLGADGAALTAVRLTRLPGCRRMGKMGKDGKLVRYPEPREQQLLYLSPQAGYEAIENRLEVRE